MSDAGTIVRNVTIHFPVGLHVRPATIIAQKARLFQSEVFLNYQDRKASTRNVFDMFLLGVEKGDKITLEAEPHADAAEAIEQLAQLFEPNCPEMNLPPE
ncbi:MAG TPA: HPr family phosphocarrier protein [Gemmatales bacterium]|nr:HPr family phosphocarrier protein [Gemmatales bacterium]HMP17070.1 HPr family phosphocarrier protein [Gemmatales bacterium]